MNDTKIIAEFMGWRSQGFARRGIFGPKTEYFKRGVREPMPFITTFLYDKKWDWLMPVVDEIESGEHITGEGNWGPYRVEIGRTWCYVGFGRFEITTTRADGATKIEAAYKTVVAFIKWYNLKKQKDEQVPKV